MNNREKKAIILMGLPLAGKTTWIHKNIPKLDYQIISADTIKEEHASYDPNHADRLHLYSVKIAEEMMIDKSDLGIDLVMDTGGINNSYTLRIINMLKQKGYFIRLVHIKTPHQICVNRNKERVRKVPELEILKKAAKENKQFHILADFVDVVEVIEYHTNKYLFVDMDGVIAAMSTLPIINGEIDFVNSEVHLHLKPVKVIIDKLRKLEEKGHQLYILSAIPNSFSYDEKNRWLDINFDIPKNNRFFVNQGKHKAEMLENLSEHLKLDKKDITMIDDFHQTLYDVQNRGMNCMHVSEFLVHEF